MGSRVWEGGGSSSHPSNAGLDPLQHGHRRLVSGVRKAKGNLGVADCRQVGFPSLGSQALICKEGSKTAQQVLRDREGGVHIELMAEG